VGAPRALHNAGEVGSRSRELQEGSKVSLRPAESRSLFSCVWPAAGHRRGGLGTGSKQGSHVQGGSVLVVSFLSSMNI
jgi:hypothetical protein